MKQLKACVAIDGVAWWNYNAAKTELDRFGNNINALELLAVLYSIKSFTSELKSKALLIGSNNMTAVWYFNEFGGIKSPICNQLTKETWEICVKHNISLVAAHIHGCENSDAD